MHVSFTPEMRTDFQIEDLIRRDSQKTFTDEYNCKLRRLLPWHDAVNTKRPMTEFGTMIVHVLAGTQVDRHAHDEEELFIVTSGKAQLLVEDQETILASGDVAYIPRNWQHQLTNPYDQNFEFVDIFWDFEPPSDL